MDFSDRCFSWIFAFRVKGFVLLFVMLLCQGAALGDECQEQVNAQIRLESPHPWRPPFGLERVGQGFTAVTEIHSDTRPLREYWLASYLGGQEVEKKIVALAGIFAKPPFVGRVTFAKSFDELVLFAKCRYEGTSSEIVRQKVHIPELEVEALARPDKVINPVDLGTIFVPYDWLLLGPGQGGSIDLSALSHRSERSSARVVSWFESDPKTQTEKSLELLLDKKAQLTWPLPVSKASPEKDALHVAVLDSGGKELWSRQITTMRVRQSQSLPEFGATELKLRYDAPISVRNPETGEFSTISYDSAWKSELKDVVVALPNGSRFVFWRGSSYIPFWAGRHNTGMSYEWAETLPPPDGFVDCVEPLMDKELRYSRVEIVESTAARVHVRWRYQSTDFQYKVWGDMPVEDYYFYPDGFGTRILNLKSAPNSTYEVQEFIIMAPQDAFPFRVLDPNIADVLFMDGQKRQIHFPATGERAAPGTIKRPGIGEPRDVPAVYRVRVHKEDPEAAISFTPINTLLPSIFGPFYDRGEMVTPFYWGSHWPLARGNMTGMAIDDRIHLSPSHNSIMTWGMNNHTPAFSAMVQSHDTLGRSRTMNHQRWYWLIGLSDASDERLLERAKSFQSPPDLELEGAHLDLDSYVAERRAMRLVVENNSVSITVKAGVRCVNPVFELLRAPRNLSSISLSGRALKPKDYAWDGQTLWLNADLDGSTLIRLEFR